MNMYTGDPAFEQFLLHEVAHQVNSKQDKLKLRVKGDKIVYKSIDHPNVTHICGVNDIREMILNGEEVSEA